MQWNYVKKIWILLIAAVSTQSFETYELKLKSNPSKSLFGNRRVSRKGREYYEFLGVRFGNAVERFEEGVLNHNWIFMNSSTKLAPMCFQLDLFSKKFEGVEDCLSMNIYTPKTDDNILHPVVVFIHGGGFQIGSGTFYDAKYWMDQNIVLVTIQYRLGAFGFLSTNDKILPGNLGLKDQTLALKWIQQYIYEFNGDKNSVSLMGNSAGGASVHYHILSKMSKNLFHTAVSLSGSALCPWAYQLKARENAVKLAQYLSCPYLESSKEIKTCIKTKSAMEIGKAVSRFDKFQQSINFINMIFSPTAEPMDYEGEKFLTKHPLNLVEEGAISNIIPWALGVTEKEGSFYAAPVMNDQSAFEEMSQKWSEIFPSIFFYDVILDSKDSQRLSQELYGQYFPERKLTREGLTNLYSDRYFNHGVFLAMIKHSKLQPVYGYIFKYKANPPFSVTMEKFKDSPDEYHGIGHVDDLMYLFNEMFDTPELRSRTSAGEFSSKLIDMWFAFSHHGDPIKSELGRYWVKASNVDSPTPLYAIDEDPKMEENPYLSSFFYMEELSLVQISMKKAKDSFFKKDEL